MAFMEHFFDYLRSPAVLLTVVTIMGPILLEVYKNKVFARHARHAKPGKIEGYFRLGLTKRSNLSDQYELTLPRSGGDVQANGVDDPIVKALFTYPVKSCRGVELAASEVGTLGLKYDRTFTFAQLISTLDKSNTAAKSAEPSKASSDWRHEWRFITQREFPRLALLETELWVPDPRAAKNQVNGHGGKKDGTTSKAQQETKIETEKTIQTQSDDSWATNGGCFILRFPFEPDFNLFGLRTKTITLRIPLAPTYEHAEAKNYEFEALKIWKDCPQAINVSGEIPYADLAKLKYFLGVSNPLALFRVDPNSKRAINRSLPKDSPDASYSVGFADAFPLHVLSMESVRALDAELPERDAFKGKLDASRFRANIYVTGGGAHDEDTWKKVSVGRAVQGPKRKDGRVKETDGEYHIACRTARCRLPNVDQSTGIKNFNEPLRTLSRTRQVDEGAKPHPCLGMQAIPLFQQGILRVGDRIQVLKRGEHYYEKMLS